MSDGGEKPKVPITVNPPQAKEPVFLFPPTLKNQDILKPIAAIINDLLDPPRGTSAWLSRDNDRIMDSPYVTELTKLVPWTAKAADGKPTTTLTVGVVDTKIIKEDRWSYKPNPTGTTTTSFGILMEDPGSHDVYFFYDNQLVPCEIDGKRNPYLAMSETAFGGGESDLGGYSLRLPIDDESRALDKIRVNKPYGANEEEYKRSSRMLALQTLTPTSSRERLGQFLNTLRNCSNTETI